MSAMPSAPVTAADHLQPVIRMLRRALVHWKGGLAALLVGVLATAALSHYRSRQYRSEAVLYYREGLQWNSGEAASSTRRMGQRLKDVALSRAQLVKVIQELNLFPRAVRSGRVNEAAQEMLLATGFKMNEGDIFIISYTGDSAKEAQRVVARLTELIVEENARLRSELAGNAQSFLAAEKNRNSQELAAKEAEYVRFLASHPEFVRDQAGEGGMGASLRPRPRDAQAETDVLALRREEQRLVRQLAIPASAAPASGPADALAAAAAMLKATKAELAERRTRYTDEHPGVRLAEAAVRQAEETYRGAAEAAKLGPSELEQQLSQVRADLAVHRRQAPAAVAAVESGPGAQRVVALETEWARLSREVAEARERLQQLDGKQFMASMTLSSLISGQAAQIVVVDPAYLPAKPVGMSTVRLFILGLALALTCAIGVAMALGLVDDRLRERHDAERLGLGPVLVEVPRLKPAELGAPERRGAPRSVPRPEVENDGGRQGGAVGGTRPDVSGGGEPRETFQEGHIAVTAIASLRDSLLGGISSGAGTALALSDPAQARSRDEMVPMGLRLVKVLANPREDSRLVMLRAPSSAAAAAFRVLRHRLVERMHGGTILVTSPVAGEGKTSCAVNLAMALGEGGRSRVLLVEANFRSPALLHLLGIQAPEKVISRIGLEKQLEFFRATGIHLWDVAETPIPGLHVIFVEGGSDERSKLDGHSLAVMVADMCRAEYQHVVVDGPATLGSADANLIEEAAGGVLMVLRDGQSCAQQLRKAIEQVGDAKLLGLVWMAG